MSMEQLRALCPAAYEAIMEALWLADEYGVPRDHIAFQVYA